MYPHLLRLHAATLRRPDAIHALVSRAIRPRRADWARAVHTYAFKCDEHGFARELLGARTELWLYRCNQRAYCGDFVVVDVSCPWPELRQAWAIELKLRTIFRVGVGGIQLRHVDSAREELVRAGVLDPSRPISTVLGSAGDVLSWFGAGAT